MGNGRTLFSFNALRTSFNVNVRSLTLNSFHSRQRSNNDSLVTPGNIRPVSSGGVINSFSKQNKQVHIILQYYQECITMNKSITTKSKTLKASSHFNIWICGSLHLWISKLHTNFVSIRKRHKSRNKFSPLDRA